MDINKEFEGAAAALPAFQTYFKIKGINTAELFRKRPDGEYLYGDVRINFEVWKAAKANAVPKGFVVLAIDDMERICRCLDDHAVYITYKASDALESIQKAMIEAQEPSHD